MLNDFKLYLLSFFLFFYFFLFFLSFRFVLFSFFFSRNIIIWMFLFFFLSFFYISSFLTSFLYFYLLCISLFLSFYLSFGVLYNNRFLSGKWYPWILKKAWTFYWTLSPLLTNFPKSPIKTCLACPVFDLSKLDHFAVFFWSSAIMYYEFWKKINFFWNHQLL